MSNNSNEAVVLEVKDVHKRLGNRQVLKGISFTLRNGEACALIGASGEGKTTLLKCINLLMTIDAGEIRLSGDVVKDPNIGGIGQLLSATSPNVIMPYGIMRISPITTPGITDRYLADKIYGFPAGGMTLMPMTGPAEVDPAKSASMYDHDLETATPYYYAALLHGLPGPSGL